MVCRMTWEEAIQSEGSKQMKILRDFMEAFSLQEFEPCQERLLRQAAEEDILDLHEQAAVNPGRRQMLVYFAADTKEDIAVGDVLGEKIYGGWFNPADGSVAMIGELPVNQDGVVSVHNDSQGGEDRVLILAAHPEEVAVVPGEYGRKDEKTVRKVFEW